MAYHYTESGLDNVWLENGFEVDNHPHYGELVSFTNVRGLHAAIGHWLVNQPRTLTGREFRFLRTELDISQRCLGELLGVTEQAVAKWEKARDKPVVNKTAERLLRGIYLDYHDGESEFKNILDRLTKLDAEVADLKRELHLANAERGWSMAA
jgi:DNA-binding transcriptional regulator YiaG